MAFIDKRKRSREDDFCDPSCMPLSKRINNLHLTNFDETQQMQSIQCQVIPLENSEFEYNPDLSEAENPYYYLKNKLLHDLHMERTLRHNK